MHLHAHAHARTHTNSRTHTHRHTGEIHKRNNDFPKAHKRTNRNIRTTGQTLICRTKEKTDRHTNQKQDKRARNTFFCGHTKGQTDVPDKHTNIIKDRQADEQNLKANGRTDRQTSVAAFRTAQTDIQTKNKD